MRGRTRVMRAVWLLVSALGLMSCDKLGIPTPEKEHALKEAEGKAVGAACRHAGRAIEDCYTMNPKALKSAVFDGWKEMNGYMSDNKIEVQKPLLTDKADEFKPGKKNRENKLPDGFPPIEPLIPHKAPTEAADAHAAEPAEAPERKVAEKLPKGDKAAEKGAEKGQHKADRTDKAERREAAGKADKTDKIEPGDKPAPGKS